MARPKVSIIVPLYNKAPYVTKALESIAPQTYTDWECIVVNDGSTDKSAEIVERLTINDERFRLINQENAGVSAARNRGIAESCGDYVAFLDADDWWAPTFLEEMMQLGADYPDAGIYGCDYYRVKNGKLLTYPKHASGYINYYKVYTRSGAMPLHPDGVLIPRHVLDDFVNRSTFNVQRSEWFPVGIKMGEDFLFFMKIVSRYKVAYLDKQLVYFNQDADANNRATTKLHDPKYHMLWNLGRIEERLTINDERLTNAQGTNDERMKKDYKDMIDFLRVFSLGAYLNSPEYHDAAAAEMAKVSRWNKLRFTIKRYWMKIDNKLKQL